MAVIKKEDMAAKAGFYSDLIENKLQCNALKGMPNDYVRLVAEDAEAIRSLLSRAALPPSQAELAREAVIERLAAECHRQWSSWWEHMSSKMTIDSGRHLGLHYVDGWQRQANTEYEALTEAEKESDRECARKMLAALSDAKKGEAC